MSIINTLHHASQAWDLARNLQAMDGWTYPTFQALFDYLDELSGEEPIEFDPRGWACEYSTWETAAACCEDCHGTQYAELVEENDGDGGDGDTLEQLCLDYLTHHAGVLVYSGGDGVVIRDF